MKLARSTEVLRTEASLEIIEIISKYWGDVGITKTLPTDNAETVKACRMENNTDGCRMYSNTCFIGHPIYSRGKWAAVHIMSAKLRAASPAVDAGASVLRVNDKSKQEEPEPIRTHVNNWWAVSVPEEKNFRMMMTPTNDIVYCGDTLEQKVTMRAKEMKNKNKNKKGRTRKKEVEYD